MTYALPMPHGRPHRGVRRALARWALFGAGVVLILVGMVGTALPGHLGLPLLVVGLAVVLRSSYGAKRRFLHLQRRHPNWLFPLRRLMRRRPQVVRVMWHASLRSERFFFRGWVNVLRPTRRTIRQTWRWARGRA